MPDLREQLRSILQGRVCLVGVGNVEQGDDGFGVRLAEALGKSEIRIGDARVQAGSRSDGMTVAVGFNPRFRHKKMSASRSDDRTFPAFNRRSATDAGWRSPGRGLKSTATFAASLRDGAAFEWDLQVIVAGTSPERYVGQLSENGFDAVVFLDVADFGAAPGSVVLLNSSEMAARFPQVSTHKLSLGLLAQLIAANGRTKVWLLAVQPQSMRLCRDLSPLVQGSLDLLEEMLRETLAAEGIRA